MIDTMGAKVLFVANRLPINIVESAQGLTYTFSIGGVAIALGALIKAMPIRWFGWAGNKQHLSERQLAQLAIPKELIPVQIPLRLFQSYYDRMSNGVIWPTLHGISPYLQYKLADYEAMQAVIDLFANSIAAHVKPDDIIWIHDYHLFLLPGALREKGVTNRVGFFMHTPFPELSRFRTIAHYQDFLASLNQADLLGVQTVRDQVNMTAAVQTIAGRSSPLIKVFPIGIDYLTYSNAHKRPAVRKHVADLRAAAKGKRVVLSVSRLDYTKGIIDQLRGFEHAVINSRLEHIAYRLIVAPSRETREEYTALRHDIERTVDAINDRIAREAPTAAILFEYRNHGFDELSAWYQIADIFLVTPVIDGMNLVVKEYIAARPTPGAVVLSKTAGAAQQLAEAILVEPTVIESIASGIQQALAMPLAEKKSRWEQLVHSVCTENVFWWAETFIADLKNIPKSHS